MKERFTSSISSIIFVQTKNSHKITTAVEVTQKMEERTVIPHSLAQNTVILAFVSKKDSHTVFIS